MPTSFLMLGFVNTTHHSSVIPSSLQQQQHTAPSTGLCNSPNASSYAWLSGTSMAVPLVVGAAALFLERNPEASPAEVKAALLDTATQGQLSGVAGMRAGTADRLLFVGRGSVAMTVQAAGGG